MSNKKFKVLVLSDHALSTSGVGTQTRHLINGMIKKGCWSFRQFGAAIKHQNYDTVVVNEDFIIKPIDGFGDPDLLRVTLASEKPDLLFIFTDPRFFEWLFKIEDEIHQVCPVVWWHVWDNYPYPYFNDKFYAGTDSICCHSHLTYTMIKENKTQAKEAIFGKERSDHFVGIWVNRNAKRKRPNDAILSWKLFLDNLEKKEGHRNAILIMHTEPNDHEGPNLFATTKALGLENNVFFSRDRVEFDKMNVLYNISDFCFTLSYAEGFGLSTLEAMMTGTPIIAPMTGGLTRQAVDHRDDSHNGVAMPIELRTLVGSQSVPYIYEDYVNNNSVADAIMKLYQMNPEERKQLSEKVFEYATTQFSYDNVVNMWHDNMLQTIEKFKSYKAWEKITF